jgi:hypothetical protein
VAVIRGQTRRHDGGRCGSTVPYEFHILLHITRAPPVTHM